MTIITLSKIEQKQLRDRLCSDPEAYLAFMLEGTITEAKAKIALTDPARAELATIPQLHIDMLAIMLNPELSRNAFFVPRGCAKTTIARLGAILKLYVRNKRYILVMNNTFDNAKASAEAIALHLMDDNFQAVFGKVTELEVNRSKGQYRYSIMIEGVPRNIQLRAAGIQTNIRGSLSADGARPDVIILDDIQKSDDANTGTEFKKVMNTLKGTVLHLGSIDVDISMLANFTEVNSVAQYIIDRGDFHIYRRGILDKYGKSIWEFHKPTHEILREWEIAKKTKAEGTFLSEMMNVPYKDTMALLDTESVLFVDDVGQLDNYDHIVLTMDPAGNKETSDEAVFVIHGYLTEKEIWVKLYQHAERGADYIKFIQEAAAKSYEYGVSVALVETVQAQAVVAYLLNDAYAKMGLDVQVINYDTKKSKHTRIKAFMSMLSNQKYALPVVDDGTMQQLKLYDFNTKNNQDDRLDCTSMILGLLDERGDYMYPQYTIPKSSTIPAGVLI